MTDFDVFVSRSRLRLRRQRQWSAAEECISPPRTTSKFLLQCDTFYFALRASSFLPSFLPYIPYIAVHIAEPTTIVTKISIPTQPTLLAAMISSANKRWVRPPVMIGVGRTDGAALNRRVRPELRGERRGEENFTASGAERLAGVSRESSRVQ